MKNLLNLLGFGSNTTTAVEPEGEMYYTCGHPYNCWEDELDEKLCNQYGDCEFTGECCY